MSGFRLNLKGYSEHLRELFASDPIKLVLSALILLSVLPFPWVDRLWVGFFAIFSIELSLRFFLIKSDLKRRSLSKVEIAFLVLDVIATLSFLPFDAVYEDARLLRLFRLSRMVLLIGYWGPVVREIWIIASKKERRYQLSFVAISAFILTFVAAILMNHFHSTGIDLNADGDPTNDHSFATFLWWSFRQIQDPGNLIGDPNASLAFFFSVFLTLSGMFIFSFLIGIATTIVEELVSVSKEHRLGMRRHSLLCNIGDHSRVLLDELVTYYRKSFRAAQISAMGAAPSRFGYMTDGHLRRVRYRQGRPLSRHDLERVDADRANRVILLGNKKSSISDSEVVSQILSIRKMNQDCYIYAELNCIDNIQAAVRAGANNTVPLLANRLVGMYLANIFLFPGLEEIYDELLTSQGAEIYTCVYGRGAMKDHEPPTNPKPVLTDKLVQCYQDHQVILLGDCVENSERLEGFAARILERDPDANERTDPATHRINGYFGVAENFDNLRKCAEGLLKTGSAERKPSPLRPLPPLGLCPVANKMEKVLICGFHPGVVEFCEQLLRDSEGISITIMVPSQERAAEVQEAFLQKPTGDLPGLPRKKHVHFEAQQNNTISYQIGDVPTDKNSLIQLTTGDWSDQRDILNLEQKGLALKELDGILFTYSEGDPDPDARTALALLKLQELRERQGELFQQNLRILCELLDTEKAELFRQRFRDEAKTPQEICRPTTVVAAENLHDTLTAQSIFVPGIAPIYDDLFRNTRHNLCRLIVDWPDGQDVPQDFSELLGAVYKETGLVAVAVELEHTKESVTSRRVLVNPPYKESKQLFKKNRITGIYAIGDPSAVSQTAPSCPNCPFDHT